MSPNGMSVRRERGFLIVLFFGAVIVILGTLKNWVSLQLAGDIHNAITAVWRGVDVPEGLVVAALGVLSLVGILILGGSKLHEHMLKFLGGFGFAAIAILAITLIDAFGALARYRSNGLQQLATVLAPVVHEPVDRVRVQLNANLVEEVAVKLGAGLWVSFAGAVILAAGVWLGVRQVRAKAIEPGVDASPDPA